VVGSVFILFRNSSVLLATLLHCLRVPTNAYPAIGHDQHFCALLLNTAI